MSFAIGMPVDDEDTRRAAAMRDRIAGEPFGPHPWRAVQIDVAAIGYQTWCPRCLGGFEGYTPPGHLQFICPCGREFFIILTHPDNWNGGKVT